MNKMLLVFFLAFAKALTAQTTSTPQEQAAQDKLNKAEVMAVLQSKADSVKTPSVRTLVDGVAGVVGEYVILDSDIKKQQEQLKRTTEVGDLPKCKLFESLLQEKMYAHHAIQDSITVQDAEINARTEQQIEYFKQELGGTEAAVASYYQKDNIQQVRDYLTRFNRDLLLANRMQERLTESVEITPEEVRQFYQSIDKEDRPLFNTEVEMAQIVINSKPDQEEKDKAIAKLKEYRRDVLENGASFSAKAILYSDDTGSANNGGAYSLTRQDGYVKAFKDAAFSLQEGEVSQPFESPFGYHILTVDKIRGQVRDVRHILLKPFISSAQENLAKEELEKIREKIILGEITFEEAAKETSEEKQTAKNGGKIVNPRTGESRLDLTRAPSELVNQIQFLQKGDVSGVIVEQDQQGTKIFKLIYLIDKIEDHKADYALDYLKIKEIALNNKKAEVVEKWQANKLKDTYIKIGGDFNDCEFLGKWIN